MKRSFKPFFVFCLILSLSVFYVFNRFWFLLSQSESQSIFVKVQYAFDNLFSSISFSPFMISTQYVSMLAGGLGTAFVWMFYIYHAFGTDKYLHGIEHGSAEWSA